MTKETTNYRLPKSVYTRSWKPFSLATKNHGVVLSEAALLPYFIFGLSSIRFSFSRINVVANTFLREFLTKSNRIFAPFSRALIIRGIGYRLYPLFNLSAELCDYNDGLGYSSNRYVYLRAGHSFPTYCGVPNTIGLRSLKRERKLLVYGFSDSIVGTFADRLFYYRQPNAFTGRGIRFKKVRYKRKPGKRAQKGRGF